MSYTDDEPGEPAAEPEFFSTPEREGLLDQLVHLLQFGEGLPVIVGAAGAGKSCLVNALCQRLSFLDFCTVCPVSDGGLSALLRGLCQRLGLAVDQASSSGELLASLRHFSQDLVQTRQQGVLILDDAHRLDAAALGALLSIAQGHEISGYGFRLLFLAREGLVERLDQLQLLDVPVYDFEMPLLSSNQMSEFLQLFPQGRLCGGEQRASLWVQSRGNPGIALELLSRNPMFAPPRREPGRDSVAEADASFLRSMPLGHAAAMLLLLGVLLWAMLARDTGSKPEDGGEKNSKVVALKPQFSPPDRSQVGTSADGDSVGVAGEDRGADRRPVGHDEPSPSDESGSGLAAMSVDSGSQAASEVTATTESPQVSKPKTSAIKPVISPPVDSRSDPIPAPSSIFAPTPTPAPLVQPSAQTVQQTAYSEDERFLLDQPSGLFTLQILAASKPDSLRSYIARQANRQQLYLYRGDRAGKRWYVVVAGVYPSKEAALAARSRLPSEQQKAGPWPRSIDDIKSEIRANR